MRRALFGIFWFGVFWVALMAVGGGISASMVAGPPPAGVTASQGHKHAIEAGSKAGVEFQEKYGRWVMVSAAVLAAACTLGGVLPGTRKN